MTEVRGYGVAVDAPAGWDVRIASSSGGAPRAATTVAPVERHALLHAATVPLPEDRGAFGGGVVEQLGPGDVFVALVEYDRASSATPLFRGHGIPRAVAPSDFAPNAMQRAIAGQSGMQRFFTHAGRAFCFYAVLGSDRNREALVPLVNRLLESVRIDV